MLKISQDQNRGIISTKQRQLKSEKIKVNETLEHYRTNGITEDDKKLLSLIDK